MIAFLGAGKLAETIITGALAAGTLRREEVLVTCRRPERAAQLRLIGLRVAVGSQELPSAEVLVLGVRHGDLPALLAPLRGALAGKTVISLVVGVPSPLLEARLPGARIVRAVPNTPAAVQLAVTALAAGATATPLDLERARALFSPLGAVVEVPEALLDAVNAVSGAGPAYLYALARALAEAGRATGLPAALAEQVAARTLHGAATLLVTGGLTPDQRIAEVAGPGGSTRAALEVLERGGLDALVAGAVRAAIARAEARGEEARRLLGSP
jgi:pyrroline-5-carboxylate reductase